MVSSADEESCNVIVVTDLRPLRIVLLRLMATDVAFNRVLILFPLLGTRPLHRPIRPKPLYDRRLQLDWNVLKLSERILSDLHYRILIVIAQSRAKNGRRGVHFVLLKVSCLVWLSINRLENGLQDRIDHERCNGAIL